jgi:ERCC4-related helicase
MSNIQSMQEQLNVSISFLASLKKQLSKVEQRLIDVTEELKEIKEDLKYLVGKSISELIDNKYTEVTEDQGFAKVHIPIKATFFEDNDQHESFDLMTGVYDFIRDTAKSTLLVLGEAGSGKSTFLKYLQKILLANWKNSKGGMSELFEGLSTDELTIVKKNLEELDLGVALTELISNMTEEDFQSRLFMPSEMGRIRAQFEKVSQTKDLTHVLKMGDPEKGIIIPIWCS